MSFQEEGTCTEVFRLPAVTSAMPFPPDRFLKTYFALGDTEPAKQTEFRNELIQCSRLCFGTFSTFFFFKTNLYWVGELGLLP